MGSVYEDDGVSLGYEAGAYRLMHLAHNSSAMATTVTVAPHAGGTGYSGEPTTRAYQVELLGGVQYEPTAVSVNGKPVQKRAPPVDGTAASAEGWWRSNATGLFEGLVFVVGTGRLPMGDGVSVVVHR